MLSFPVSSTFIARRERLTNRDGKRFSLSSTQATEGGSRSLIALDELPPCCTLCAGHTLPNAPIESRYLTKQDSEMIASFFDVAESPDWKPVVNYWGPATTKKYQMQKEGSPINMIKGTSSVKATAFEVFSLMDDRSKWEENMRIMDTMFIGGRVVETYDPHHGVCHAKFRTPPTITNREVVFVSLHCMMDEHTFITLAHTIVHKDVPDTPGFVRGEIMCTGYLAQDTQDGCCNLVYIVQVDPKGWLPAWVVNICAADQADNVTRIAKFFAAGKA